MGDIITVEASNIQERKGFNEYINDFLASLDIKPKSKETYFKALKQFIKYMQEIGEGNSPTRETILNYKQYLMSTYSAYTVSAYLVAVKRFFEWAESMKYYPNVAGGIKGAKTPKGFKKDALTVTQVKNIFKEIDRTTLEGKRNYALLNLLVRTGLRTIEIERANIEDIRQEGGEALLYIQGKGRDSKDAFVLLTEETLRPVRDYLQERGIKDVKAPLFASISNKNTGGRLTTRSISRIVKESFKKVGLNDNRLTAHSLRHTAVTFSLLAGASIQEAQSMARHSNINTTMIYAHNIDRISKAPERKIDTLLS